MAAGQGITLTAASTVVISELVWTPGVLVQAEDRAHRIGQEKSVNIHYLYGPGTLDEHIWPRIRNKLSVVSGALDDHKNDNLQSMMNPQTRFGMGEFETIDIGDIIENARDPVLEDQSTETSLKRKNEGEKVSKKII
mmetsp:Transcript_11343/g.1699  ORF Transcript_11343/g.1699 Transcript_11343/m.1699 type:complete len:137 (+) Transcript_11343:663-1073(+)